MKYLQMAIEILSALFAGVATYYAWRSARAAERAVKSNFLPIVKPYRAAEGTGKDRFILVVRNISDGQKIAQHVEVKANVLNFFESIDQLDPGEVKTFEIKNENLSNLLKGDDVIEIKYKDIYGDRHRVRGIIRMDSSREWSQVGSIDYQLVE